MHLSALIFTFLAVRACAEGINVLVAKYAERTRDELQRNYKIDWNSPPKTEAKSSLRRSCYPGIRRGADHYGSWLKLHERYGKLRDKGPEITIYVKKHNETSQNNWGQMTSSLSLQTWTTVTGMVTEGWTVGATLSALNSISISSSYSKHYTSGTSTTTIKSQDVPCPPLSKCTVQTWTYHVNISGHCERIPFIKNIREEWDPCDFKSRTLCQTVRDFIKETCHIPKVFTFSGEPPTLPKDFVFGIHKSEPCQFQFPIFDQTGKPFTKTHLFTTHLSGTPKAYDKQNGWCLLDSGDWYRDDYDLYWDNEKSTWAKKPWAIKPDITGFEPCHGSDDRNHAGGKEVPKLIGKDDNGYCYLNETHYYADMGKYWTEQRGWYPDSDAPQPDTSSFTPCPGDETAGSKYNVSNT